VVVTTDAYRAFVQSNGLDEAVRLELSRKPFNQMRWEEIWDASLRIRNRFSKGRIPDDVRRDLAAAIERHFRDDVVAVRSSAPGEDASEASFAGLHDSFVNVAGAESILDHIVQVWASLWSDRALLYRQELELDVATSAMAVIVQKLVVGRCSGITFTIHPSDPQRGVIEAVWGLNQGLVDGTVEPDRWILDRASGEVVEHTAPSRRQCLVPEAEGGVRLAAPPSPDQPPLDADHVGSVWRTAADVESLFESHQDVEWTTDGVRTIVLQARPVTATKKSDDQRAWYLSLRRSYDTLVELRRKVEEELLPELDEAARQLAAVPLTDLSDADLAAELGRRTKTYDHWVDVYWRDFIPLAHGIRLFGEVYNELAQPADPYEFVTLLIETPMLSLERNHQLESLAHRLRQDPLLLEAANHGKIDQVVEALGDELRSFLDEFGSAAFGEARVFEEQSQLVAFLAGLASRPPSPAPADRVDRAALSKAFLDRVEPSRRPWATDLLELARSCYRLRDDDNIQLGRLKTEALRARDEALQRLGRGDDDASGIDDSRIARALRDPNLQMESPSGPTKPPVEPGVELRPRQLVGQPAAPGVAIGSARVVTSVDDLFRVESGEVIVCDAIDPNMTFVVPLAAAVVERRGGMLIHGAIIAREYGLPCVTGISGATTEIENGVPLTVDGYLGIVTVG
jgi:pyruvate,water dikinase